MTTLLPWANKTPRDANRAPAKKFNPKGIKGNYELQQTSTVSNSQSETVDAPPADAPKGGDAK